jgi:acyl-CoA thioesterase-1
MMGWDMREKTVSRRRWVGHCIALALSAAVPGLVAAAAPAAKPQRILVLGDSLSAEYGLVRGTGWVALLEQRLQAQHLPASVTNASISGDTTAGGRSRLPALLKSVQPTIVIIELGGNDALQGMPLQTTRDNLRAMAAAAKASGAQVVIVGMQMPPNYGRKYASDFAALYPEVARAEHAALVPFLLAGVADAPNADTLFQADKIHPTAQAHPRMRDNVWAVLQPLLLQHR